MSALGGHVLVLNQDYRALSVCSVERAVVLLWLHKVELVHAREDQVLHSARAQHPWPSIVRLKVYVHVPYKRIMLSRKNVLRRDRHRCQYCRSNDRLTIDHVLPKSRGGKDTWENLVAACVPCNNRKGNRTPEEAAMPLLRKPFRPSHVMFIRDFIGRLDEQWKPYLFLA
ncbi:MAG: HNH endonuclease [Rhodothermales bacterium]|jgi:5-methylcytosine-specific restriction endonuclease McrA